MLNKPSKIPSSTDTVLVFPIDPATSKFDAKSYYSGLTDNRVDSEEIKQVLIDLETVIKPISEQEARGNKLFNLVLLIIVMTFISVEVFALFIKNYTLLCLELVIFLVFVGIRWFVWGNIKKRYKKRYADESLRSLNKHAAGFVQKGLSWKLPESYPHWIELHKEYMTNPGGYSAPAAYKQEESPGTNLYQNSYYQNQYNNYNQA